MEIISEVELLIKVYLLISKSLYFFKIRNLAYPNKVISLDHRYCHSNK